MTDQERQLLQELAGRIQKAPAPQVDREADDLIRRGIGARPDALYILTQTVLVQEMALNQAKQELDDLKRRQPPQSFLPSTPSSPAPSAAPPSGYRASSYQSGYAPPPPQPPPLPQAIPQAMPQYEQPAYYAPPQPSGFSGFLRNAAQTAAGIVAGEVAFSAISSMFGHHDTYYGGGGGGFLGGGGSGISPVSETIITNNYYDDDRGREHDRSSRNDFADTGRADNYVADNSPDVAADSSSDDSANDDSSTDDSGSDDSSSDSGSDDV